MMIPDANISTDTEYLLAQNQRELPAPAPWSAVAVRLLQGVVYNDDNLEAWETLLANISPLTEYFGKLGLALIVSETDAMAYLRQPDDDEVSPDHDAIPRLFRRTPLGYDTTLLCVLLRDELRLFEEEDVQNARCVVRQSDLLAVWQAFFPQQLDSVKLNRSLGAALRKLEDLKFVRQFEKDPPSWEIRRIIKARLPIADLEKLRQSLVEFAQTLNIQVSAQGDSTDTPESLEELGDE
ncbi:MAG: DUF4194 domain-containing protein [Planctomycetales bacterium]|nr:DUF4194 domain-containing protein [Planctomycetales bacterium]